MFYFHSICNLKMHKRPKNVEKLFLNAYLFIYFNEKYHQEQKGIMKLIFPPLKNFIGVLWIEILKCRKHRMFIKYLLEKLCYPKTYHNCSEMWRIEACSLAFGCVFVYYLSKLVDIYMPWISLAIKHLLWIQAGKICQNPKYGRISVLY